MTRRTPQIEAAILRGVSRGQPLAALLHRQGVSHAAFLKWRRADPRLDARYHSVRERLAVRLLTSASILPTIARTPTA